MRIITLFSLLLIFVGSLSANSDMQIYNDIVFKHLGGFGFFVDGFTVSDDGLLSVKMSSIYYFSLLLLPLIVGLIAGFVGNSKYFKYNFLIFSAVFLNLILILTLGILSKNPSIQKDYETQISEKYKIEKPVSIFFNRKPHPPTMVLK